MLRLDCRARAVPLLSKEGLLPMADATIDLLKSQFPAVPAAVDESGVRAACTGRRRDQLEATSSSCSV